MFDFLSRVPLLDQIYFGNTLFAYIKAIGVFVVLIFLFWVFQRIILSKARRFAEKTQTDIDDTIIGIIRSVRPGFYFFFAMWVALHAITINDIGWKIINALLVICLVYLVINAMKMLIDYVAEKKLNGEGQEEKAMVNLIRQFAIGLAWVLGVLVVLSNLGVNVTSLIAGLGIGGVAVALALQNILSDLFSSFAIYFDKPFKIGDHIVVGEHSGNVEKIGIKTTRIRSFQGEEIVISNHELTSARIQNFRKLKSRRVVFSLGITYETAQNRLEEIPKILEEIIKSTDQTSFDRTHFIEFGDSALLFEIVYHVLSKEFGEYRDVHQKVLFSINAEFKKKGIDFAYPTQTLYVSE